MKVVRATLEGHACVRKNLAEVREAKGQTKDRRDGASGPALAPPAAAPSAVRKLAIGVPRGHRTGAAQHGAPQHNRCPGANPSTSQGSLACGRSVRGKARTVLAGTHGHAVTPGVLAGLYTVVTQAELHAAVRHGHRSAACAMLRAVRGESAAYNKLFYAFQCEDIGFDMVRTPLLPARWPIDLLASTLCDAPQPAARSHRPRSRLFCRSQTSHGTCARAAWPTSFATTLTTPAVSRRTNASRSSAAPVSSSRVASMARSRSSFPRSSPPHLLPAAYGASYYALSRFCTSSVQCDVPLLPACRDSGRAFT